MSNIKVFNYQDSREVRVIEQDGEPWFVAKDVCDILGIADVTSALRTLDDDEKVLRKISGLPSTGGNPNMMTISESGLYTLIMRSNRPEAKQFRRWVTHEVLPDIRKHGMYLNDKAREAVLNDPEGFNNAAREYAQEKEMKYVSRGIMSSAARIFDRAFDCKEEKDFKITLALDKIFKDFTGKSALEIAGVKLKKTDKVTTHKIKSFWGCENEDFEWDEVKTEYSWESDLLGD